LSLLVGKAGEEAFKCYQCQATSGFCRPIFLALLSPPFPVRKKVELARIARVIRPYFQSSKEGFSAKIPAPSHTRAHQFRFSLSSRRRATLCFGGSASYFAALSPGRTTYSSSLAITASVKRFWEQYVRRKGRSRRRSLVVAGALCILFVLDIQYCTTVPLQVSPLSSLCIN